MVPSNDIIFMAQGTSWDNNIKTQIMRGTLIGCVRTWWEGLSVRGCERWLEAHACNNNVRQERLVQGRGRLRRVLGCGKGLLEARGRGGSDGSDEVQGLRWGGRCERE